jgi:hypothetical protein
MGDDVLQCEFVCLCVIKDVDNNRMRKERCVKRDDVKVINSSHI